MDGLEEWNTTYSVEDGVEEFMFPMLDDLMIQDCPMLRLKPCPPTFRVCDIKRSDQVTFSLEEVNKDSHHSSGRGPRGTKLSIMGDNRKSMRIFHHFPALRELTIIDCKLAELPESMRHLTSLDLLKLVWCDGISALPEWLGDLSSLRSLVISGCRSIKSLPSCIQQLTKLQKLEISDNLELKKWCESEENTMKLAHISVQVSSLTNKLQYIQFQPSRF
jgi:Leucine-rich repeat (LRR) protein